MKVVIPDTEASRPIAGAVADRVAARIEQLIADGVFAVGQSLPAERELSASLGFSRPAVREGLRLLRGRGLLRTEHGRGTFVANLHESAATTPLLQLFASQPRTLYDLLEVRALLEGESARLAAIRGTDADFVLMARRYEELRQAESARTQLDVDTHARLDHAFHLSICEASHNPVLLHTLRSLTDLLLSSVFAAVVNLYHRTPYKELIDTQHAKLYQAVLSRKPDLAQRAALDHLHGIRDALREIEQDEQRLIRSMMRLESRS
jgi:GntR family transcriptional regulator, glc operon transcriptional activator